jgi:hypothetical protein
MLPEDGSTGRGATRFERGDLLIVGLKHVLLLTWDSPEQDGTASRGY